VKALVLALLGLLACAPPVHAQTPGPLDELMQLLARRQHGHVAFTEVHQLAVLQSPLRSSGELVYDAPDRLEKRTLTPRPETLRLAHGELTMERNHRQRVLALRDYPQIVPFVESIRATLAGDRAALERYFEVRFEGSLADWTLELRPRDAQVAASVRDVRVSGARDAIHQVQIRQSDGDQSVLTIGADLAP
jgi:Outer membrane lipoprotein carrier protein LolA-like